MQDHRHPLAWREGSNRPSHHRAHFGPGKPLGGLPAWVVRTVVRFGRHATPSPPMIPTEVDNDPVQPGREPSRRLVPLRGPIYAEERFLGDVFREFRVAGEPAGEANHALLMALNQLPQGSHVPGRHGGYQRLIADVMLTQWSAR